ncbi:hypothetical protein ACPXCO_24050 [Streptomyces cyaneofuscatus]|uniref:hypothetical protein n=1 Tax=Streptomyces cyaneofuscatus TaxID=66883 RepID=UPI003CF3E84C
MFLTRISAHAAARQLDPRATDLLTAALAELGLSEPIPDTVHHAFVRPQWRYRLVYRATTAILECASAHREHADSGTLDLEPLLHASRRACSDIIRAHWMRGTIPFDRRHRVNAVRTHTRRVVNRVRWAERSLDADPANNLPAHARRWLTIADRYMECRIGALLDDVEPSVARRT